MIPEGGSATVLAAAGAAVLLTMAVVVADAGRLVSARVAAQTAADAAALAAAPATFTGSGRAAAAEAALFAEANGARLVACTCPVDPGWRGRTVTVEVVVDIEPGPLGIDSVGARASAELDPTVWFR